MTFGKPFKGIFLGLERAKVELMNDPNGVKALVKTVSRISDNGNCESAVNSQMILFMIRFGHEKIKKLSVNRVI